MTTDDFLRWRAEQAAALTKMEANGFKAGWETRRGGGVVVIQNPQGYGLTFSTLGEATACVYGWEWGYKAGWGPTMTPAA